MSKTKISSEPPLVLGISNITVPCYSRYSRCPGPCSHLMQLPVGGAPKVNECRPWKGTNVKKDLNHLPTINFQEILGILFSFSGGKNNGWKHKIYINISLYIPAGSAGKKVLNFKCVIDVSPSPKVRISGKKRWARQRPKAAPKLPQGVAPVDPSPQEMCRRSQAFRASDFTTGIAWIESLVGGFNPSEKY